MLLRSKRLASGACLGEPDAPPAAATRSGRATLPATRPWASVTASRAWVGRVATRVCPDITDSPRTAAKVSQREETKGRREGKLNEFWRLLFCSVRSVRTSGPHLRPGHRSLRVPDPDLRRALRPMQARLLGFGGGGWVQAVRVHPRLHETPLRPPGTMPLQDRLRGA